MGAWQLWQVLCLILACGATAHDTISLREKQLHEMYRPMLTSRYLAGLTGSGGDFEPVEGAAFGQRPSLVGTSLLKKIVKNTPDPEPRPFATVPPFDIMTTSGKHEVAAGRDASYLFVIYSKQASIQRLWYNSSATAFFRALPPKSHVVFAATDAQGGEGAVQALRTKIEGARGFSDVRDRLHFVEEPITLHCTEQEFPKCPLKKGQSIFHQAVVSWGSIEPSLVIRGVSGAGGNEEELDASGATGWLPSIIDVIKSKGAQSLKLANWNGEACDDAPPLEDVAGKMAIIRRGTCGFYTKVSTAMKAGAAAVLVINTLGNTGSGSMGCGAPDPCDKSDLTIPAAMISFEQGQRLLQQHAADSTLGKLRVQMDARYEGEHFIGIDHRGRLRELGSVPTSAGDADLALAFVALEAQYYAYEAELDDKATQKGTLALTLLSGSDQDEAGTYLSGGRGIFANVIFPKEEVLAQYDTMQILMQLECKCGMDKCCGEWDYVVHMHACTEPSMTPARPGMGNVGANGVESQGYSYKSCNVEVGRWVTAYGRAGKWITDASAALPLLRQGGRQHFIIAQPEWSQQKYRVVSKVLLSNTGKRGVPVASLPLFSGGNLDDDYNSNHLPITVDIPYRTMRAEIHSFITGHGWGKDLQNCAEFCETGHRFSLRVGMDVDGETYVSRDQALYQYTLKDAGSELGCAAQVQDGVTPNQYGTWNYGRAGWCPGGAVAPWIVDVTAGLRPGMKAVIAYAALFNDTAYIQKACEGATCNANGYPAEIKMRSRLVLYEHRYDKDLNGEPATAPTSWERVEGGAVYIEPPAAHAQVRPDPPNTHPPDDGETHWGWLGGSHTAADTGLWPSDDPAEHAAVNGVPSNELPTDEQGKPFIPGYSLHEAVEMLQVGGKEARRAGEEGNRAWRGGRGGGEGECDCEKGLGDGECCGGDGVVRGGGSGSGCGGDGGAAAAARGIWPALR